MNWLKQTNSVAFLKTHWLIVLIVIVASWLRVWQLDTHAILFSDAGKDLLVAYHAVQEKTLPLLGISSSVPRFKQGPVSIWIEMATIALFGVNTLAVSLVFAFLAIAAVIALYEYVCITIGRKEALLSAALLAASPLAVAHARVPYHTTPLPLALVLYFFSLHYLSKKNAWYQFFAGLSYSFLFQFELAVAPLFLLIPFTIWYQKIKLQRKQIIYLGLGLVLGVWPQIVFDLTNRFAQLGTFVLWIGHKVLEFVTFSGGGTTTPLLFLTSIIKFGTRLVSVDNYFLSSSVLLVLIGGVILAIRQLRNKTLSFSYLLAYLSFILLLGSYFIHGAPSEAYFPPFFILIPIMLTHTVFSLAGNFQKLAFFAVTILVLLNCTSIVSHNFFVSNNTAFSYGPSVAEQRQVLSFINSKTGGNYELQTFEGHEDIFVNYFDNYRWLVLERKLALPQSNQKYFYIQNKETSFNNQQYFYQDFQTIRVFWFISE